MGELKHRTLGHAHKEGDAIAIYSVDDQETQDMLKTKGDVSSHGPHPISTHSNHPSLDTLLAALPCPVYYLNSAGICLGCNQAFQDQIIGEFDLQIIGQSLVDIERLLPRDMVQIFAESDATLVKKSGCRLFEEKTDEFYTKSGNDGVGGKPVGGKRDGARCR